MRRIIFYIIFFLFIITACSDKYENQTHIKVSPNELSIDAQGGEILEFNITGISNLLLTKFKVDYKVEGDFTKNILDSSISITNFNYKYEFLVPEYDETEITARLTFTITDEKGISGIATRTLYINNKRQLVEVAGHEMYSSLSQEKNAFDIVNRNPIFSSLHDSSEIGIIDASVDSIHGNMLSREWRSYNNTKFVRYNDFDYANATKEDLINSYNAGTEREFLTNIQDADIILTTYIHGDHTDYVAIKVTNVIDQDSTLLDRYIFNIKL